MVIKNLKYWGAPRNDGFVLMPNEVEAYRVGPKAFEFKGTNGFMITIDMTSKDLAPEDRFQLSRDPVSGRSLAVGQSRRISARA